MKRIVGMIALLVIGFLISLGSFASPSVTSAISDRVTAPAFNLEWLNQLGKTEFVYQRKMADGTLWQAYGKGRAILAPHKGDEITLTNAKGEMFRAKVIRVFKVPAGSRAWGETWIEFENLTPARGQPVTGSAVIFAFWRVGR